MLVIAQNMVLSEAEDALPDGTPYILYENVVTFDNISADSEDNLYPAINLANPATNQEWRAAAAVAVAIDVDVNSIDLIDGAGIARHNFGSAGITVTILSVSNDSPPVETIVAGPQIPPDDQPLLFQFTAQAFDTLRIELTLGSEAPRAAVLYVGKLLVCERSYDVGQDFTPPRFARKTDTVTGKSTRGDYLGRIVLSQWIDDAVFLFKHFTPDWYRSHFDPFVLAAQQDVPFFFAWQPEDYPYEVAYAWLTEDPMPVTSPVTGRKSVSIKMGGIVE